MSPATLLTEGSRRAYLVRSAPGCRPRLDGESEGTAGSSGGCSRRGEGRGAASSSGGAGGCVEGGAHDPFRPAEEPLRATQDVSITLTPMLVRDTKTRAYPPRQTAGALPPKRHIQAGRCWNSSAALAPSRARGARGGGPAPRPTGRPGASPARLPRPAGSCASPLPKPADLRAEAASPGHSLPRRSRG